MCARLIFLPLQRKELAKIQAGYGVAISDIALYKDNIEELTAEISLLKAQLAAEMRSRKSVEEELDAEKSRTETLEERLKALMAELQELRKVRVEMALLEGKFAAALKELAEVSRDLLVLLL